MLTSNYLREETVEFVNDVQKAILGFLALVSEDDWQEGVGDTLALLD